MKQLKITLLSALLMSMTAMRTLAFDAIIDDICYDFSETEATVTYYVFGTGNGLQMRLESVPLCQRYRFHHLL